MLGAHLISMSLGDFCVLPVAFRGQLGQLVLVAPDGSRLGCFYVAYKLSSRGLLVKVSSLALF